MTKRLYEEEDIRKIAQEIRSANGETAGYKLAQMPDKIKEIAETTGGGEEVLKGILSREIKELTVPEGGVVGNGALSSCTWLEKLTLPKNVEVRAIGMSGLSGTSALELLIFPESLEYLRKR